MGVDTVGNPRSTKLGSRFPTNSMQPLPNYFGQLVFSLRSLVPSAELPITNGTSARKLILVTDVNTPPPLSFSMTSSDEWCSSVVRGNINTAALVTVAQCNTLVARCSRQLTGPADWVFVTLEPLRCD